MRSNTHTMGTKSKLGLVAGLAAAAASAYYFYYSKGANKNRAKAKAWMIKAENEIMARVEKLKESALTEENFRAIIKKVTEKYRSVKNISSDEVDEFIDALSLAWKEIKKRAGTVETAAKKGVKRVIREAKKSE